MEPGECLSSYDVSALFTSVPIDPALKIIKDLLDKDTTLKERTVMEGGDIIHLLEFCLKNICLSFQGQVYEQVEGAAMGSPVSPIVANLNRSSRQVNDGGNSNAQSANHGVQSKGHIVIPYTQGLCESIKKICGRYGIQTHFKGGRTIKNLLVSPKDKDPMVNQSGAIYWYQCGDLGCDDEYIGETSRTFGERYKEHLKAPSAIHHHSIQTGHTTNH